MWGCVPLEWGWGLKYGGAALWAPFPTVGWGFGAADPIWGGLTPC